VEKRACHSDVKVQMQSFIQPFLALPPYALAALVVLLLYAVQSEVRFGRRARTIFAGPSDRGSTLAVSVSAIVPVFGFVLVMKAQTSSLLGRLPAWLRTSDSMPGMPSLAWVGVGLGVLGLLVRLWALLTVRERYTRTLRVDEEQRIERSGPYRFVRHPGYLDSLLCLNGIALATGNAIVFSSSILATFVAYAYRIRIEDTMLIVAFGPAYESYRRDVSAVVPFVCRRRQSSKPARF
jgi:protein-S-isoprenylcysteine O-methyltransferase Ste14